MLVQDIRRCRRCGEGVADGSAVADGVGSGDGMPPIPGSEPGPPSQMPRGPGRPRRPGAPSSGRGISCGRRSDAAGWRVERPTRRPHPTSRGSDPGASDPSRVLQLRSGAAHGRAEGTGRGPEDDGGFVIGGAFERRHDDRGSFQRGEVGHRRADIEPAGGDGGIEGRGRHGTDARHQPTTDRPEPVRGETTCRGQQPWQDRPAPVEPVPVIPQPQVRVLGEVLRRGPVVGPGEREPEDVRPVRLEGALVRISVGSARAIRVVIPTYTSGTPGTHGRATDRGLSCA